MKLKKNILFLTVFALLVTALLPANVTAYAAAKNFTYAEQKSGAMVRELTLTPGEKVDLKFIGVSDYKKYSLVWTTSNPKVATVDKNGIITAKAVGTTEIKLLVGDGKTYTSNPVKVTVGYDYNILLGTSGNNCPDMFTLQPGKSIDLNFYGVLGWTAQRYVGTWSSTNPQVANVNNLGIVKAVKEGITIVTLTLKDNFSGRVLLAKPVAINVVKTGTPTPTPKPTGTPKPTVTPKPTTAPTPAPGSYNVTVDSSSSIVLEFPSRVSYTKSDISLYRVFKSGSQNLEYLWSISDVTSNTAGTKLTVETESPFTNGETYVVRVGGETKGKEFTVSLGQPNRIVLNYECLGAEGVAYAQGYVDTPVTLTYRLYHDTIDVTEEYENSGYVDFELVSPKDSFDVDFTGNQLTFYAERITAVVRATYHYGSNYEKELQSPPVSIVSKALGAYSVKSVDEWTIIDETKNTPIDWSKPVHEVIAGASNRKFVLLFTDAFGVQYSTDERGVDEENGIYSIADDTKLFAANGGEFTFESVSEDKLWVDPTGMLEPYTATTRAVVYVAFNNYQSDNVTGKRIGTLGVKVLKEPELATIDAETKTVTLATKALPGFENRFCKTDIKINMLDQYGNIWDGEGIFEVRCTTTEVNNAIGGVAYMDGNILHINAEELNEITRRTSLSFIVTEIETNKRTTVTLNLKVPTDRYGEIALGSWNATADNISLAFTQDDVGATTKYGKIEFQKLAKIGVPVGLYDSVRFAESSTDNPKKHNDMVKDDIMIFVTGPENRTGLKVVNSPDELGLYWDAANSCVRVIAAAPNGSVIETLPAGKYTVKIMKVTSDSNSTYSTKNIYFTITDDTPEILFKGATAKTTSEYVSNEDDVETVKSIVADLFTFALDGKTWSDWDADMIADVDFTWRTNYITVKSVTFLIPCDNDSELSYQKVVKFSGGTIRYGVDE